MIYFSIKHKTKQRLAKAVNVFVQFTFVVYSVGFGFLAAPMQAHAASAEDVTRPDAPNPTLEQFVQQSLAGDQVDTTKTQTKAAGVELAPADANPIYAWDRTPNPGWSHGQISGYYETEDIPFLLELNGLTAGTETTVQVKMEHKKYNIVGLQEFRHANATTEPGLIYNADRTPFTISTPTFSGGAGNGITPQYKNYTFTFTPTGASASLYWDALVALGAHNYSGAELDVRYASASGDKTVPISTNEFLFNTFTVNKFDTADPIFVGETTNYHIQFVNTGNAPATNVVVTDVLPAGLSYVATVDSDGGTVQVNGQTITTTFASVDDGTGREIILEVRGDVAGKHTNPASVVSSFQPTPTTDTEDTTVVQGNPDLPLACGLDIALVIDSSGSIDNTELTQMKNAYHGFVNALLPATPTQFSVVEFDTNVIGPTLGFTNDATTVNNRINAAVSGGWTNWEDALLEAHAQYDPRTDKPDLVLFASDGNPNTVGVTPPSSGGTATETAAVNAAVARANAIKADGIRILALGIGDQLDIDNLKAISGQNVNTGNILTSDVITSSFATLAADLANVAAELCGGTISVKKFVDGQPASGWQFTAGVTGGIATPNPATTDGNGELNFAIDISGETATVDVTETVQSNYDLDSAACTKNQQPIGTPDGQDGVNGIVIGHQDIISCTFNNTLLEGSLELTKAVVGGTASPDEFSFTIAPDPNSEGPIQTTGGTYVFDDLLQGNYTVSEAPFDGYHVTASTCTDVYVPAGQQAACRIENTRDTGNLTIIKLNEQQQPMQGVEFQIEGQANPYFTDAQGRIEFTGLETGDYNVTEVSPLGYSFSTVSGANCTNSNPSTATVVYNETTTCTFTNTRDMGTIYFHKDVRAWDGANTDDNTTFTLDLSGETVINDIEVSESGATWREVPTGNYSVAEDALAGYTLTSITNSDSGASNSFALDKNEVIHVYVTNTQNPAKLTVTKIVMNDNGGTLGVADFPLFVDATQVTSGVQNTIGAGTYTVSETGDAGYTAAITGDCDANGNVTLGFGEVKSCTITNNDNAASLTVIKHVENNNGGTLAADDFTMNITASNASDDSFPGAEAPGTTITLDAGAYGVDENFVFGYAKTLGTDCAGEIANGEHKTCTITNDDVAPQLRIVKEVVNNNGGTLQVANFPLYINGSPVTSGAWNPVTANTLYTATEDGNAAYAASAWAGDCSQNGTITLLPGEQKTCTITNDDIQPRLTVTKIVTNDNGGNAVVENFPLFVGTTSVVSGVQNGFNAGAYVVSETNQDGYTGTIDGDCDVNGNVTLSAGDVKNCTITNNDVAPTITLVKDVRNNNGGTAGENSFGLTIGGTPVTSGQTLPVLANAPYALNEVGLFGYSFVSLTGEGCPAELGGSVTLDEGEDITCTITNDDIQPKLTVYKIVNNDNGGSLESDDFTMHVAGTNVNPASFPGSSTGTLVALDAGSFTVSEDQEDGYTAVIGGDCAANGTGNIAVGEEKSCVVTNTAQAAYLIVTKHVENDNGGNAVAGDFALTINGVNVPSGATFAGQEAPGTVKQVFPGDYSVSEDTVDGYTASYSDDCDGAIALGETKFCTVTNNDVAPTITLVKEVINDDNGNAGENAFGLTIGGTPVTSGQTLAVLANTQIALNEAGLDGYTFVSMTGDEECPDVLGGTVTLDEGEDITCTITNDDVAPTITLEKAVTNDDNGTAGENAFGLTVGGTPVNSGQVLPVQANMAIALNETGLAGYEFVSLTGDAKCPTVLGGTVTLDEGEDITCTITNDDIPGTVSGYKSDTLENRLNGWEICLVPEAGRNLETVAPQGDTEDNCVITGSGEWADGYYEFTDVPQGSYTVYEVVQDGWMPIDPASGEYTNVFVGLDQNVSRDFVNFELGSITGMKFNDVNGNGSNDDEPGLSGWTIQLWVCNPFILDSNHDGEYGLDDAVRFTAAYTNGPMEQADANGNEETDLGDFACAKDAYSDATLVPYQTTITDGNGNYAFTDLGPGTYWVTEVPQEGWQQTAPELGYHEVLITSGADIVDKDFGNFQLGRISGYKYDAQENRLNGWEICLVPAVGQDDLARVSVNESEDNCVITGSGEWEDGYYEFTGLFAGMYTVQETQQAGWEQVFPSDPGTHTVGIVSGTGYGEASLYNFMNRQLFPDLTIAKDDGLTQAEPGTTLTYAITVTNDGEYDAHGVFVLDTLPAHVTYVSDTSSVAVNQSGATLTWDFPALTLAAGESMSFDLTVKIDAIMPSGTTTLTNAVVVSTESVESDLTNNSASDATNVSAAPVIAVQKSDSPDPVEAGGTLTYTINWTVTGNAIASGVTIVDTLDANTSFVSASNSGVYDANTHTVSWNLGSVTPADSGSMTIVTTVASPLANGTELTNTVVMDSNENTPVNDEEPTTVTSAPELAIAKDVNRNAANPGNTITYSITIENLASANAVAENVVINDTLPGGFTLASNGEATYSFTVGDLAPGASQTVSFDVVIAKTVTAGTYTNTGIGDADNSNPVEDSADITVVIPQVLGVDTNAELTINKTVDRDAVNPRGLLLYTVTVANVGDETATNVTVTDSLPQGFTFVSDGEVTKTFTIGDLEPSHSRTITYQVRVAEDAKAGTYTNLAVATAGNASKVADQVDVEVRPGRVLAATGAGALEYTLGILGALLSMLGIAGIALAAYRRQQELEKNA